MGCCAERMPDAHTDIPVTGAKHTFKIVQDKFGQSASASDNCEDPEKKGASWLRLETSNSMEDKAGSITLKMAAGPDTEKELAKVEVTNEVKVEKLEDKMKVDSWGSFMDDTKVKVVWECTRNATITVGEKSGTLKAHYVGKAEAKKDVDLDSDGRSVEWKKEAEVKEIEIEITLDGKTHSIEVKASHSWDYEVRAEGWFEARYETFSFGRDLVHVTVDESGEPISGCALGFLLAFWLHPKRLEDNAAQMAMDILSKKASWF